MSEQGSAQKAQQQPRQNPKQKQESKQKPGSKEKQEPKQESKQESVGKSHQESRKESVQTTREAAKKPPKLDPKPDSQQPSAKEEKDESGDGEDLTTILDEAQRADLTLLLANATESMRKLIEDNFDASAGLQKRLLRESMTEDEKLMSANIDPGTADVAAFDRERKLKEHYEKELSASKTKDLKKDALQAFDEWRQTVIERVGQVVNSERTATGQLENDAKAGKAQPQAPDQNPLESVVKKPPNQNIKLKFKDLYPPTKTALTKMSMQQRTFIVHSLLLLLLSLEHYNAPSRVLLLHVISSLKLPLKTFEQDETTVAKGLLEAAKELTADEETQKKVKANKETRKWRVGLATAAGAAVIGISGGMAAPLVSAGVGTIMGSLGLGATAAAGYLGSVAGSTVLVGGLFGAYGGRMTGEMMDKYAREVEDFEFLPVHSRNKTSEKAEEGAKQATEHNHKLRVTICISGWLTEKDEVVRPWKVIGRSAEVFALKWELEALLNLGNAMNGLVQSAAWGYAQKQLIQQTIFADLMAAMWPIGLVKAAGVIDNPFSVAKQRSEKAGEVLADALVNRAQGERPVTLIGYSLGARVIYTCLKSLARRKAFGLVESAVLIGAPTPSDTADWRILRTVVSARLVNVYSENDYVLGLMYRTSSIQYGIAGLQKIEGLSGVENVNVSEDVKGHLRYRYLIGGILKKIGFEDIDMQAVEEERVALEAVEEEEKKNSLRAQKNRLLRRQSTGGDQDEAKEAEEEANEMSKQVAAKTQKTLVTRAVEYFYLPKTPSTKDIEKNLGNIQKAAADPSEAGSVAMEAVRDIQKSGQSYAQWAAQQLPSLTSRGGSKKATQDSSKLVGGAVDSSSKATSSPAATAQSYTEAAASYLPSFGGSKKSPKDSKKAAGDMAKGVENAAGQASSTSNVKDTAASAVSTTSGMIGDNASAGKKTAENAIDQTPAKDIKDAAGKAASRGQETVGDTAASAQKATADAASNTQSYTKRAAGYLPSLGGGAKKTAAESKKSPSKGSKESPQATNKNIETPAASAQGLASKAAGYLPTFGASKAAKDSSKSADTAAKDSTKAITNPAKDSTEVTGKATNAPTKKASTEDEAKPEEDKESKAKGEAQSYASRATSYLPNLGFSRGKSDTKSQSPNLDRTTSESKKKAPKLEEKTNETAKSSPNLERKASEATKSTPKLEKRSSEATKSTPKLEKRSSEATKSTPKLDRKPSEVKKSIPKLDRKPSESQSKADSPSVASLERTVSETQKTNSIPKLDRTPSGMKSPPARPSRTPSGAQSPSVAKLEGKSSQKAPKLDQVPSGVKKGQQTVQKGVEGVAGGLTSGLGLGKK